jgi:hypothetical protein
VLQFLNGFELHCINKKKERMRVFSQGFYIQLSEKITIFAFSQFSSNPTLVDEGALANDSNKVLKNNKKLSYPYSWHVDFLVRSSKISHWCNIAKDD